MERDQIIQQIKQRIMVLAFQAESARRISNSKSDTDEYISLSSAEYYEQEMQFFVSILNTIGDEEHN
jgi:hypothetical protein